MFEPTIALWFCTISHCLFMSFYIFRPKKADMKEHRGQWMIYQLGRNFYFLFGFLYVHTAISWLSGVWIYEDIAYQLPAVILVLIMGIYYIVGFMLLKPRLLEIIWVYVGMAFFLIMIHLVLPIVADLRDWVEITLILLIAMEVLYPIILYASRTLFKKMESEILEKSGEKRNELNKGQLLIYYLNKQLWKKSIDLNKLSMRIFNWTMWALLCVESLFKLFGTSILIW